MFKARKPPKKGTRRSNKASLPKEKGPEPQVREPRMIDGMVAIAYSRLKMNPAEAVAMALEGPFVVCINRQPVLVVRSFLTRGKGRRPANERRKD